MTLALQWGYRTGSTDEAEPLTQGFLYMSCITSYKQSYTGAVSKQPIDGGGNISDHFTRENPVITLGVVISAVDISISGINITDVDGNTPTNIRSRVTPAKVNSDSNSLIKFLPNTVGQFFTPQKPSVVLASQSVDTTEQIRDLLKSLFNENAIELVTLYEYQGNNLKNSPTKNLVMTSLSFNEDSNTGEGIFADITLEQVTFVQLKKSTIPKNIADLLKKKGESTDNKGKVDSTPQDGLPDYLKRKKPVTSIAADLEDGVKERYSKLFGGGE